MSKSNINKSNNEQKLIKLQKEEQELAKLKKEAETSFINITLSLKKCQNQIKELQKQRLEKNTINQKKQTNSFPQSIIFQKIPKNTKPNDVILHGTVYLKFTLSYGEMCFDSCNHFPNNSQKCKKCILSGLNDEYASQRLLGYDLEISIEDNNPQ